MGYEIGFLHWPQSKTALEGGMKSAVTSLSNQQQGYFPSGGHSKGKKIEAERRLNENMTREVT